MIDFMTSSKDRDGEIYFQFTSRQQISQQLFENIST